MSSSPGRTRSAARLVAARRGSRGRPLGRRPAALEHVGALEVARARWRRSTRSPSSASPAPSDVAQLADRPHVELALDALGVGVERGAEAALGPRISRSAQSSVSLADAAQQRLAGHLPAVQVGPREQRVVVEHLLEVGHGPGRVDRVAGEAAADLVVDAAGGHRPQRRRATSRARRGPAGTRSATPAGTSARRPKPPLRGSKVCAQALHAPRRAPPSVIGSSEAGSRGGAAERAQHARRPARGPRRGARPRPRRPPRSTIAPARHPVARLGREVGADEERRLLGGQEHVQRPAALAGHRLQASM